MLAALGAGCLTIQVILLLVAMAGISAVTASCASSCSDSPIGDSREAAAFIASLDATSRDLGTFDALRGCFESLHESLAVHDQAGLGSTERLLSVDELRSQIALGEWPSDDGGALSPRVWVRIAELSQDYLEEKTGEQWEVVDFAYAFPNNGPIPIPPTRDENSHTSTLLLCTDGADEGTFAYVMYYRWRSPALFEDDLVSQTGVCLANSSYLREYFAWKKVPVYLETRLMEVKDGAVVCADAEGKEFEISCDNVISCAGYLPAPLASAGKKNVQFIGDCRKVGNLRSVIWGAYEAAMKI